MVKSNPLVSVVIPAYNEEKEIGECLSSLSKQSYSKKEIIVVDDGSTDKTAEIASSFKNVRLVKGQHKGPGTARNLGVKHAKGKIIVLVDADMTFDRNYIKELISPILAGEAYGTEDGKQIASNPGNVWSQCWGTYFKEYINPSEGQIFRAILKKNFVKMGGFDPAYGYADDLTFYYKYKATSLRVPKAICYHKNPASFKEVYKQSRWIGASIQSILVQNRVLNKFTPLALIVLSPVLIPLMAIRKTLILKKPALLFPWMLLFMLARYFGSVSGIIRKAYFDVNVK